MHTLLILRHAKSSWKHDELADHDRPLNKRGRGDAPRVGFLLRQQQLVPDQISSSTAVRAATTAEIVARESGFEGTLDLTSELYLAAPDDYVRYVRFHADEQARVMVVGHNPGLQDLLQQLTGTEEALPTAALAQIDLDISSWREFSHTSPARLACFWRPKDAEH